MLTSQGFGLQSQEEHPYLSNVVPYSQYVRHNTSLHDSIKYLVLIILNSVYFNINWCHINY